MHESTMFNIRIDFEKSHDSYIYDKNRKKYFLDFFGNYATLPLGYNHEIFDDESFRETFNRIAGVKVTNCEIISDEAQDFLQAFSGHEDMRRFKHFHFCCTGALAIEAAIKIAIDQKPWIDNPTVLRLGGSFHGINSYGGFVTDRFYPVSTRLDGFPTMGLWYKLYSPNIVYKNNLIDVTSTESGLEKFRKEFYSHVNHDVGKNFHSYLNHNVVALLVEPIQSTSGDRYYPKSFFREIRNLCNDHGICLIFDEIQCGFGVTGKMWYHQHLDIEPDIVAFGKKSQVSGVMAKEEINKTFKTPTRLEVTWDGTLVDMVRCTYILKAYEKYNILRNTRERGDQILKELQKIDFVRNARGLGLLVCFDLETSEERDCLAENAFEHGLIFNKTVDRSIRLRPNLNVTSDEVLEAIEIIKQSNDFRDP